MRLRTSHGFTLVELLVVVAIIGVLVGMLLPAVNAARESSRCIQCRNNLKQIAMAFLAHEEAQGFLPTGGWSHAWMGDSDRGFSNKQPGGWCFNILPNIDQDTLWRKASASDPSAQSNLITVWNTPVPAFNCPTRRRLGTLPTANQGSDTFMTGVVGQAGGPPLGPLSIAPSKLFRGDYAANMGGWGDDGGYQSTNWPSSYAASDGMTDAQWDAAYNDAEFDGICFKHSQVKMAQITDGKSCTYCVCEKYLDPDHYFDGVSIGDDQGAWIGFDRDIARQADPADPPLKDTPGLDLTLCFGSAHTSGWNASFCDGAARLMTYSIDIVTHQNLASRNDGNVTDMSGF
jgi:prepilin-type N-terminal cleavage/methylation domain-containing protein